MKGKGWLCRAGRSAAQPAQSDSDSLAMVWWPCLSLSVCLCLSLSVSVCLSRSLSLSLLRAEDGLFTWVAGYGGELRRRLIHAARLQRFYFLRCVRKLPTVPSREEGGYKKLPRSGAPAHVMDRTGRDMPEPGSPEKRLAHPPRRALLRGRHRGERRGAAIPYYVLYNR